MRLSSDKDDAGYRDWCILNGDNKIARVFLDGVEQKYASMADDELGEVRRTVLTSGGNFATDTLCGEILTEIVKGTVEIRIEDRA
ncbi:hypothetical protein GHJ84_29700 [Sinorhizobium meliloti]|jgi:hypothetical protein|uniref:hypothetical protein n=1 Tax=Rhizobium meliloti TaxID=382 RepID=UPI001295A77E|nr:hypothetical protein [Sinorhizobium meliloti]MQX25039.1 hypothetical protein [Sinorhizobium meliloti]